MSIAEQVLSGDIRALSQLITCVESEDPASIPVLRALYPHTGQAHVIGFTGAPGAGKSSVIGALLPLYLSRGHKVAVIAVDPTSAFTGGGVLGDRVRMPLHDENLYIRSLGARGQLGGLSRACGNVLRLLDAAGYSRILVETVGAGQSEIVIRRYADTVVVLTSPHQGDDIQAMKAGILEIGDIYAVNKAELPDAERTAADLIHMIHLLTGRQHGPRSLSRAAEVNGNQDPEEVYVPPVVKVSVRASFGVQALLHAMEGHYDYLDKKNLRFSRRLDAVRSELEETLLRRWGHEVLEPAASRVAEFSRRVAEGSSDPWSVADALWRELNLPFD